MSNEQILTKAIEKAQKNGWYSDSWHRIVPTDAVGLELHEGGAMQLYRNGSVDETHVNEVIYNHDFAKALWANEPSCLSEIHSSAFDNEGGEYTRTESQGLDGWQYHLQQMVIADDPIKYLGEHL